MFKTAITEMFGVKYPIICGAMMWLCKPTLCAAVSNAGGIGNLKGGFFEVTNDYKSESVGQITTTNILGRI